MLKYERINYSKPVVSIYIYILEVLSRESEKSLKKIRTWDGHTENGFTVLLQFLIHPFMGPSATEGAEICGT